MGDNDRALKILIFVAVGSYFAYALYWFVKTIPWIVEISLRPEYYYPPTGLRFTNSYSLSMAYLMEYSAFFGLMVRVVGACYALVSAFIILKIETNSFLVTKYKISKALLLEGLHYLSFIPVIYFLLEFSALPSVSYLLLSTYLCIQILLISPFLISLSIKVRKYSSEVDRLSLLRLVGLSSVSYIIALWVTYMLKWTEMNAVDPYLFSALSFRILGFFNTIVTQSLAVFFAVIGLIHIFRKSGGDNTMRWWGLSLIFLSAHVILYVMYVTCVGITRFIPFGELYVVPLIGLGIYLLVKNPKLES